MKALAKCCCALVTLLVIADRTTTLGLPIAYYDGTFNNSDWTLTPAFNSTAPGESGFSATQEVTGGNYDAYRSTSLLFGHGYLVVSQLSSSSIYNPKTQGGVTSIDFSYDFLKTSPQGFGAIYYSMALVQNGAL